jgi:hypothetical protein
VLLASDLNAEFNNILNNAADLVSPFTKAISMGGFALNFDAANTIALTSTTNGLSLTGGAFNTLTGTETLTNKTLTSPTITSPTITNPANTTQALTDAATVAWDASSGAIATLLATNAVGNTRAMGAPTNLKTGGRYVLHYTQDATGGRALTFNAVFAGFSGGAMPSCNTVASGVTVFAFESPDGTNLRLVAYSQPRDGPIAAGKNIAARTNSGTPNTKLDITADQIVLQDAGGNSYTANTVSGTIDFGTTGANGLDTSTQASSTWYYGYVIAKPDGTVAVLGSTSATAPTMPAGYTFKALVTAARSDGSTHFLPYRQFGNRVYFETQQSALSNGTATAETAVSLTALVPPSATELLLNTQQDALCDGSGNFNDVVTIRVVSGSDYWKQQNVHTAESPNAPIFCGTAQLTAPNISQNVYYLHTTSAGSVFHLTIWVCGFTLPGGGE